MGERRPIVGVQTDVFLRDSAPFHGVGEKYIQALVHGANAQVVLLPSLAADGQELKKVDQATLEESLLLLDGLFLPGSPSDIHFSRYAICNHTAADAALDPQRDEASMALIRLAVARGLPVLGVCRGLQDINVALGGTLHQHLPDDKRFGRHGENESLPREERYGYAHRIALPVGGRLSALTHTCHWQVNSLHSQGIDQLAEPLQAEAIADDGLIEAVSLKDPMAWLLAVQWHPEWRFADDGLSTALFHHFGEAMRAYQARRTELR